MKKINLLLMAVVAIAFIGCKNAEVEMSDKEKALQKVVKPYVENTVIATYSALPTNTTSTRTSTHGRLTTTL